MDLILLLLTKALTTVKIMIFPITITDFEVERETTSKMAKKYFFRRNPNHIIMKFILEVKKITSNKFYVGC